MTEELTWFERVRQDFLERLSKLAGWAVVFQQRMGRAYGVEDCKDMESWKSFHNQEK